MTEFQEFERKCELYQDKLIQKKFYIIGIHLKKLSLLENL